MTEVDCLGEILMVLRVQIFRTMRVEEGFGIGEEKGRRVSGWEVDRYTGMTLLERAVSSRQQKVLCGTKSKIRDVGFRCAKIDFIVRRTVRSKA
jgi:hypothetical protein